MPKVTLERRLADGAPMLPRTPLTPAAGAMVEDALKAANVERMHRGQEPLSMAVFIRQAAIVYARKVLKASPGSQNRGLEGADTKAYVA